MDRIDQLGSVPRSDPILNLPRIEALIEVSEKRTW